MDEGAREQAIVVSDQGSTTSGRSAGHGLPDFAQLICGAHHWLTGFAAERFGEFGHIDDHAVDAEPGGRVRIDLGAHAQIFGALVGAIPLRESNKEALLRR